MPIFKETTLPRTHLLLDPNNYRYQDQPDFVWAGDNRFHLDTVQERAYRRLRDDMLIALKNSILRNGFIPVERVVVRPYDHAKDRYVVIEGNRRVAALRWIADDIESGVDISKSIQTTLNNVPVILVEKVEDDPGFHEALMGIRHVGGIKQWGGYQRAKLVAELRDRHGFDGAEVGERLGITTQEVNRRYRAYKTLDQMENDEEYADSAKPGMYPIFHEAVSLPVVRDWLGWNETTYSFQNADQIHEFYDLITSTESEDGAPRPPKLATYADVRELREIIPNEEAKRILLDPYHSFFDAISIAKQSELSKAWKSQIATAITALRSISALELGEMSSEDLEEINKLVDNANKILETHKKLSVS